jgi:HlyD family secretion protein
LTVVEGTAVKAGDLLAELDHEDLKATLQQLQADATVAEHQLEALKTLQPSDIEVAQAVLTEAKAQLDFAERNKQRLDALVKDQIASRQAWDAAANDLDIAKARHRRAEVSLDNIKTRFRTDIATAEAKLRTARATMESISVQIRWSVLRSPLDGQVFAVHQREGELTSNQPQAPVVTLLDTKGLQLHLYVDEADVGRIQLGQKATFRLDAHPDKVLAGRIVRILPQPILQENVVYYLAVVDPEEAERNLLRSEMTALGYVELGAREGILRLPLSAVKSRSNGWYVMAVETNGHVERPVQIGWKDESGVEIRDGLKEGDVVLAQ